MADDPNTTRAKLRRTLADSATFIQARERSQGLGATTFDELSKRQIDRIRGAPNLPRPGQLERLAKIETGMNTLLEEVEAAAEQAPPDDFFGDDEG